MSHNGKVDWRKRPRDENEDGEVTLGCHTAPRHQHNYTKRNSGEVHASRPNKKVTDFSKQQNDCKNDPFPYILRCQPSQKKSLVLWWQSPLPVKVRIEEKLIPKIVKYNKRERGMFKDQPVHRTRDLQRFCDSNRVSIEMALSLRRHHMKQLNPFLDMQQLRLGAESDIRESARLFEVAVAEYLHENKIPFYSEKEQRTTIKKYWKHGEPHPPTPDFVLKEPIVIKKFFYAQRHQRKVVEERKINWIEAKMFYGASTIEPDMKSAVGCLLNTANKYRAIHGEGAIIFMQGYGDQLAQQLREVGVLALNGSSTISLHRVREHQRTWCADEHGNILP